jgi:uncharacterized protein YndB with AHSA1/START domain
MSTELVVRHNVVIQAPVAKVWQMLVVPRYIKQWDELPEDFNYEEPLRLGREIVWTHPDGKQTWLTVIELQPHKKLQLSLYNSDWTMKPRPEEVGYTYTLSEQEGSTGLSISIGDFAKIDHGTRYYEASLEFAEDAGKKIKKLAEEKSYEL